MAMTEERTRRSGTSGRTRQGGRRRAGLDREAVRSRRDHEARVAREARARHHPDRARSRSTWRSASAASRAAGSRRSSGPKSSGKTTVCQHVLAEAQARGGVVAFIDVEHALDPGYARACGVNVDELLVSQPDTGEQALEITETLIRSGGIDCVVVDSVAALVPRAEIEGEMGDSFMGVQARLMSQALRKLTGAVSRSNTALIFTNQLREKIGVMFGNPETTPGGRAMKFYASVRLDIRRIETIKTGTESVGNRVRVKVVKNKVAAAVPGRRVRHHVRRGHLQGRRPARRRRGDGHRHQDRRLVHVRRDAARPGPRGVQGVPQGQPADRRRRSTA